MSDKVFNELSVDLIGIAGLARSGKSTLGKKLSEKYKIPTYALADPVKRTVNEIFLFDYRHSDGDLKESEVVFEVYKGWKFKLVDILRKNLGDILDKYDRYELLNLFLEKVLPNIPKLRTENLEKIQVTPRDLYQHFGTEFGRSIHSKIWLKLAEKEYEKFGCLIITDVRFENEAKYVRDNGGRVIHVNRKDRPKIKSHRSERGIKVRDKDIILNNDGDLDVFCEKIHGLDYLL